MSSPDLIIAGRKIGSDHHMVGIRTAAASTDSQSPMRVTRRIWVASPALLAEATMGITACEKPLPTTNNVKNREEASTPAARVSTLYQPSMMVSVRPTAAWAR